MPGFENYAREAAEIEREILRHGIALGIDWENEVQVHTLAREALACHNIGSNPDCSPQDPLARARIELFGLAQLMLTVMRQSADENLLTHGGQVWKTFAHALWSESAMSKEKDG